MLLSNSLYVSSYVMKIGFNNTNCGEKITLILVYFKSWKNMEFGIKLEHQNLKGPLPCSSSFPFRATALSLHRLLSHIEMFRVHFEAIWEIM